MVLIEVLFTTLVIDAYEGREVATFDDPGTYFHADMTKDNFFNKNKNTICGYIVSDQSGSQ